MATKFEDDDFEFPDRSRWGKEYNIPVRVQKKLIPNFVKLSRKILKRWKDELDAGIVKNIVSIRIKEGRAKARVKEDPLLVAIKNNDSHHLGYFNLESLTKERFLLVLDHWLKANDEIKSQIFKTPYANLLNNAQYFDVLKSWLNNHSYFNDLPKLNLDIFHKLEPEYQYKVLEKFIKGSIKNISPLPSVDEVKQIILPRLFTDRDEAEKLFLQYKVQFLYRELKKYVSSEESVNNSFAEKEVKQLKVIKKGFTGSYYPSINELKLKVEVYEWILCMKGNKRAALCSYFSK